MNRDTRSELIANGYLDPDNRVIPQWMRPSPNRHRMPKSRLAILVRILRHCLRKGK